MAAEPETVAPEITRSGEELDTGTIARVLAELEPVDQTTSFAQEQTAKLPMLRAEVLGATPVSAEPSTATAPPEPTPTPAAPQSGVSAPGAPGKRRAVKHAGPRGPLFKGLPSAPVLLGIAALAVSVGGVVAAGDSGMVSNRGNSYNQASALSGAGGIGKVVQAGKRGDIISRDDAREAQSDAAGADLQEAAEGVAEQRDTAIIELRKKAEAWSKVIEKNLWRYPTSSVQLTAQFGQYGLWSNYHTGLDFNGNTGDPVMAVANGVVTSAGYDGAYGNKIIVQLEDGTEIWFCHLNSFGVSVGDSVRAGEVIGTVGATGNVTGSHLHLEVRPGGGDPVDPYAAMQQHGLF